MTGRHDDPTAGPDTEARHPKAPVPKQRTPGPYRVPPREKRNGLVLVFTGDGKGKTTAALGILLRARGRDMSVAMLQFIKTEGAPTRRASRGGASVWTIASSSE